MFLLSFSAISEVIALKAQNISSEWLHTAFQMVFNQKYSNFKIRSIFRVYLENSPVNTFDQPHGSDQCGYIHLLHGSDLMETVVRVGNLCRLGCICFCTLDFEVNNLIFTVEHVKFSMPSILDSLEHTAHIPWVIVDNLANAASAAIEVAEEASKFVRYFSRSLHYDAATTAI